VGRSVDTAGLTVQRANYGESEACLKGVRETAPGILSWEDAGRGIRESHSIST